jgi:hypothetical protein
MSVVACLYKMWRYVAAIVGLNNVRKRWNRHGKIGIIGCHDQFIHSLLTSQKIASSSPNEVIEFFSIYLILPATPWHWGLLSL